MSEETFKASNGWTVKKSESFPGLMEVRDEDGTAFYTNSSEPFDDALTEYCEHVRDTELGRVRWPEDPGYVIYRVPRHDDEEGRCVRVFHEPSATVESLWERWHAKPGSPRSQAARWYFNEGPGKTDRPWRDAQPGEVWRLTVDGYEGNYLFEDDYPDVPYFFGEGTSTEVDSESITAGRKLVNADGSLADDQG